MTKNEEIRKIIKALEGMLEPENEELVKKCREDAWYIQTCKINLAIQEIDLSVSFVCLLGLPKGGCSGCLLKKFNDDICPTGSPVDLCLMEFMKRVVEKAGV